ncbi:MAG: helix-turn-helix transcriptional regulator [Butyrivibrio hungatei]|nr:helix-turn-helix transcriptional regulator [Butyrivibrio hungatei]
MDQKKIGLFLKDLRKEKGITQEELAQLLGVSSRSVSRWETGSNMPDISLLSAIADYYDVDVREIIDGERKSGMNEEIKEVADKMADYAGTEKGSLFKWVRIISLIGTMFLTLAVVFQCIKYEPNIFRFGAVVLSFLGLVALAVTTLYANGILEKLARKKHFTTVVRVIVILLIVISIKFIMMSTVIIGLGLLEGSQPYDKKSGIDNYDKEYLLEEYGSDLDTGLFIFPNDGQNAVSVEYESALKTGMFDTDGYIFLSATYEDDEFQKEIERLSKISCTVFETNREDSDYHIENIIYDTENYNFPAYVTSDGYSSVYEYALIDNENKRIIYVLLSHPDIANDESGTIQTEYLKKDVNAYDLKNGSTLERFSIYSFGFSKGIWSEYSPEDEGRETSGKQR